MKNIFLILLAAILFSCGNQAEQKGKIKPPVDYGKKIKIGGEAQGTYWNITYYDTAERILQSQIDSLLSAYDMSASNYVPTSIISKVNDNRETKLDSIFMGNFLLSQQVAKETGGDFDITVRPLVDLWGFGKEKAGNVTQSMIDSVMEFVGYEKVKLEDGKIVKSDPRIRLDFNAIAQGYSVDVVSRYLKSLGISNFLVDIGGELYASGTKEGGQWWRVGVERPKDNEAYGESLSAVVKLKDKGLATSGNYRKFYVKNGIKYSHTIDPHTGRTAQRNILSATIIAKNAALADAYATACMVMGIEKAKSFLKKHPQLDAFLIYSGKDGAFKYFYTRGMKDILEELE